MELDQINQKIQESKLKIDEYKSIIDKLLEEDENLDLEDFPGLMANLEKEVDTLQKLIQYIL